MTTAGTRRELRHTRFVRQPEWWTILAVFGLFITGLPSVFTWPANAILFNPSTYKEALARQPVQEDFPLLIGQLILQGGNSLLPGTGTTLFNTLEQTSYPEVIREMFPPDWVRVQTNGLVDQFWAYLNQNSPEFHLMVDLHPVKNRLQGDQANQIASTIVDGLPGCSQEDLIRIAQLALSGALDRLPLCRPPSELQGLVTSLVRVILAGSGQALPEQVDLAMALRIPAQVGGQPVLMGFGRAAAFYRLLRSALNWLPAVAILFLALTVFLGRRTWLGSLYWVGLGLGLSGAAGGVIALLLGFWANQVIFNSLAGIFPGRLLIFDLFRDALVQVQSQFTQAAALTGLVIGLLGAGLIFASFHTRKTR